MQIILIVLLILAVLLVIFTLQNSTEITVHLFLWDIANVPLALVILGCVIIGYIISAVYFYPRIWKLKKENRQLQKSNNKLKNSQITDHTAGDENINPEGIELEIDDKNERFFKD